MREGYCRECLNARVTRVIHRNKRPYYTKAPGQVLGSWWFPSEPVSDGLCERCRTTKEERGE